MIVVATPTQTGAAAEALLWCVDYFKALDESNAAIHCAPVRYSPITFRIAEALDGLTVEHEAVFAVMSHRGVYAEDPGR